MSNIVWSPQKGWHNGPEVEVKVVRRRPRPAAIQAMHQVAKQVRS